MKKDKKRFLKLIPIGLIIMILITTPTKEKFDKWILQEYGIDCDTDNYFLNVCYKGGEKINFKSSHFRNAGLFASYEKNYEYENGEKVTFRTLGVLGTLIQMKDGYLWGILN